MMRMETIPGKSIGGRTYIHVTLLPALDAERAGRVAEAERLAGVGRGEHFDLVRFDDAGPCVALLAYPRFFEDPFPALRDSWLADLERGSVRYRSYADSLNPPILHRKELLLPPGHPDFETYAELTATAESIGLFDEPTRIGYRRQWQDLIRERGYRIDGHALVPIGNDESDEVSADLGLGFSVPVASASQSALAAPSSPSRQSAPSPQPSPRGERGLGDRASPGGALELGGEACSRGDADSDSDSDGELGEGDGRFSDWQASRQLTALVRYGFLDGGLSLFDYGCGRGDDVRGLVENGISASGWDPYHAPDDAVCSADIVNLGFVVNVIEDFDERVEALTRAFSLARRLLVVSVMLANQNAVRGERFRDGVLTRRGTFQKYFTQAEVKAFVEAALGQEPIAVAPGVLYVFRDQDAEQRFLVDRYRSRRSRLRDPSSRERAQGGSRRRDRAEERYQACREPLDRLWERWLSLGRRPDKSEVGDLTALIEGFGTLGKALRFVEGRNDMEEVERARCSRTADLEVYFALNQFERRRPYKHLERGLQRDIKAFCGDYAGAQAAARELLFRIADVEAIAAACRDAAEQGLGWLDDESAAFQLHVGLVERLPTLLRVVIGCAALLYGDYRNADLVKVHVTSGKVSLMRFDDFDGKPLPRMVERVKLKLREQGLDWFGYGAEFELPLLYRKSRYINEEFPRYPEQLAFEEALAGLGLFDFSGYGPRPEAFDATLATNRWSIDGYALVRSQAIPDLDAPCGRYFTFRQLVECGETQQRTGLANLPKQADSYNALNDLAVRVLDPLVDWFGMPRLSFGFCSPALARKIHGRIDPKRDQHAAHELNRLGRRVCDRLGAAVDFIVEDENMLEVAQWLVANTAFDRLYFYGDVKPIHVSCGPDNTKQVVKMMPGKSGKLIPRVISVGEFLGV